MKTIKTTKLVYSGLKITEVVIYSDDTYKLVTTKPKVNSYSLDYSNGNIVKKPS